MRQALAKHPSALFTPSWDDLDWGSPRDTHLHFIPPRYESYFVFVVDRPRQERDRSEWLFRKQIEGTCPQQTSLADFLLQDNRRLPRSSYFTSQADLVIPFSTLKPNAPLTIPIPGHPITIYMPHLNRTFPNQTVHKTTPRTSEGELA